MAHMSKTMTPEDEEGDHDDDDDDDDDDGDNDNEEEHEHDDNDDGGQQQKEGLKHHCTNPVPEISRPATCSCSSSSHPCRGSWKDETLFVGRVGWWFGWLSCCPDCVG